MAPLAPKRTIKGFYFQKEASKPCAEEHNSSPCALTIDVQQFAIAERWHGVASWRACLQRTPNYEG